jgi:hypothetical protein
MSGTLLGNARAEQFTTKYFVPFSITSAGIVCTLAVVATALVLPKFWLYRGA